MKLLRHAGVKEVPMWVFTKSGFYSAVKKPGCAPGELEVRARCKGDFQRLIHVTGASCRIIDNAGTDYPFRVRMHRTLWADFVYNQAIDIDYDNFKGQIDVNQWESMSQRNRRHDAYMGVWRALLALEETMPKTGTIGGGDLQDDRGFYYDRSEHPQWSNDHHPSDASRGLPNAQEQPMAPASKTKKSRRGGKKRRPGPFVQGQTRSGK
jgi:hypothetical protein